MRSDIGLNPLRRIIGESTNGKGPILFCLAGIHGNETAGVKALQIIFDFIHENKIEVNGTFLGVAGNLSALKQGKRFIDMDMNRQWAKDRITEIRSFHNGDAKYQEEKEMKELLDILHKYHDKDPNHFLFLDLHTTSAFGGVFSIVNTVRRSLVYATALNVPVLTGIDNVLEETSLNYLEEKGIAAVGFEAGQHDAPGSVENMVSAIFITLCGMGILKSSDVPQIRYYNKHLHQFGDGLPKVVEFVYRHEVDESDNFQMRHGYENFQRISKGDYLADDKNGKILSPESGMILMPLYQKQGSDGFFIIKEIKSKEAIH